MTTNYTMTKLIFDIDDDLNKKFRDTIYHEKGLNKGVIKDALREAIELWINTRSEAKIPS